MVGILGSGSWATALAKILTDNNLEINWWLRQQATIDHITKRRHNQHYLSSAYFEVSQLHMDCDLEAVIKKSKTVLVCIPSAYLIPLFENLPKNIFDGKQVISAIKGILPNEKHQLLNEYLIENFNVQPHDYFSLMGPCHAEEVSAEKLSYLTFSGISKVMTQRLAGHFETWYLNTVVNQDVWGSQYAAVLKNIYAVGAGIAHGLDYGDNFLSVYIANAANEMVSFLKIVSEKKATPPIGIDQLSNEDTSGPSAIHQLPSVNYSSSVYLGDLLVTCYSLYSRNRTFGNMIGKGYSVKVAQLEMNMVAEGFPASKGLYETNQSIGVNMPIAETIYKILWEGMEAKEGFEGIEDVLK